MKTKTIRCFPSEENAVLERMHLVGYKLKQRNEIDNIREVYDGSVSVTRGNYTGTDVYTHTERNHYLSLLFEKDIEDEELDEKLDELERRMDRSLSILDSNYDKASNLEDKLKKGKKQFICGIFLIGLGIVFTIIEMIILGTSMIAFTIAFGLVIAVTGIVCLLIGIKKKKGCPSEIEACKKVINNESENLDSILHEAKKYEKAVRDNYRKQ